MIIKGEEQLIQRVSNVPVAERVCFIGFSLEHNSNYTNAQIIKSLTERATEKFQKPIAVLNTFGKLLLNNLKVKNELDGPVEVPEHEAGAGLTKMEESILRAILNNPDLIETSHDIKTTYTKEIGLESIIDPNSIIDTTSILTNLAFNKHIEQVKKQGFHSNPTFWRQLRAAAVSYAKKHGYNKYQHGIEHCVLYLYTECLALTAYAFSLNYPHLIPLFYAANNAPRFFNEHCFREIIGVRLEVTLVIISPSEKHKYLQHQTSDVIPTNSRTASAPAIMTEKEDTTQDSTNEQDFSLKNGENNMNNPYNVPLELRMAFQLLRVSVPGSPKQSDVSLALMLAEEYSSRFRSGEGQTTTNRTNSHAAKQHSRQASTASRASELKLPPAVESRLRLFSQRSSSLSANSNSSTTSAAPSLSSDVAPTIN